MDNRYEREGAPLASYAAISLIFVALLVGFFLVAASLGIALPARIGVLDMLLLGVATHKISWLLAGDVVTSFVRAPLTRFVRSMGPDAAMHEMARGRGPQFAVGELLTCPWCTGLWVALALVAGLVVAPAVTRFVAALFAVLMLSDFLQIAYVKFGGDISHSSDPSGRARDQQGMQRREPQRMQAHH